MAFRLRFKNCVYYAQIDRLYAAYIADGLRSKNGRFVEDHIRRCEQCFDRWEELVNFSLRPVSLRPT